MPGLILKLRAHEQILVNGVVMQNGDRNARLIVKTPDAKILRLRDAIHPEEATTPVKRTCYIAQLAVAGETDPDEAHAQLETGIRQLRAALDGIDGAEALDLAEASLAGQNFYAALRALRKLIPIEEELLANSGDAAPVERTMDRATAAPCAGQPIRAAR
ncbi:MAG: flagellar biosynthesis repressor FlbT [Pseudomonadota bacterium]